VLSIFFWNIFTSLHKQCAISDPQSVCHPKCLPPCELVVHLRRPNLQVTPLNSIT